MSVKILLLLLITCIRVTAQDIIPVTFGPLVSMTSTSLKASPAYVEQIAGSGYNIGGFARLKILFFYGQAEASFGSKSSSATFMHDSTTTGAAFRLKGLDISIIGGMKLFSIGDKGNFRIMTGYSLNNYSDITYTVNGNNLSSDNINKHNNSILAGIGFDISRLTIDLRYSLGLSDLTVSGQQDVNANVFSLTAGIKILN